MKKVLYLAKNDYYVLVFQVLTYLYNCLKNDEQVDMSKLTPEYLAINKRYFEYIFDTLGDEGLIVGKGYYEDMVGKHLDPEIMISPKGISFLHENTVLQKVRRGVKGITDIVGNIPGL